MDKKREEEFEATVDGDEVEVEVVEGNGYKRERVSERMTINGVPFTKWQLIKPFIGPIIFFSVVFIMAITVFVWMIPVLIPVAVVYFLYKILSSR